MDGVLFGFLIAAMVATLGMLFAGIIVMARGGAFNRKHANTFMRWRVALQATAILIFVVLVMLLKK
jgi:hypothetical protein